MLAEKVHSEIESGNCDGIPLVDEVLSAIRVVVSYFDTKSEQSEKDFKDILSVLRDNCVKNVTLQNHLR